MKQSELKQLIREEIQNYLFSEFMLEWIIPGKEVNTLLSSQLKTLINYVEEKNITKYTIKGRRNNKWEVLINNT